jgi:hypothetical protein
MAKTKRQSAIKAAAAVTAMTEEMTLDERHLEKATDSNKKAGRGRWTKEVSDSRCGCLFWIVVFMSMLYSCRCRCLIVNSISSYYCCDALLHNNASPPMTTQ